MLFKAVHTQYSKLNSIFSNFYDEEKFLVFFRITISLVAIIEFLSLLPDLSLFFSSSSQILIPQDLMFMQDDSFKYLNPFYQFLRENHLLTLFYNWAPVIYLLSLVLLLFGFVTRISALLAIIFQLLIFRSFVAFNYGYDYFLTISLFYCFIFPVGKYFSIDSKIFWNDKSIKFNYRRVLQIHLAIAYFFSGIAKALDIGWWNGNSIWRAIAGVDNTYHSIPFFLMVFIGIITVLAELLYPFLMLNKNTRKYILLIIIGMHTSIAIFMNLYAFSAIMITLNIAGFGNLSLSTKKQLSEAISKVS